MGLSIPLSSQEPISRPYNKIIFNPVLINPAYCGTTDHTLLQVSSDLEDMKQAHTLTLTGKFAGERFINNFQHGIALHHEGFRFSRNLGFTLAESYQVKLGSAGEQKLSLGASFTGQYNLRKSNPELAIFDSLDNSINLNAGAGIFYRGRWLYAGISGLNLLGQMYADSLPSEDPASFQSAGIVQLGAMIPVWTRQSLYIEPAVLGIAEPPLDQTNLSVCSSLSIHFRSITAGVSVRDFDPEQMAWYASAGFRAWTAGFYLHNPLTGHITQGTMLMEAFLSFSPGESTSKKKTH